MKKVLLASAVVAAALVPSPAHAAAPDATGIVCGFSSVADPLHPGVQIGEVDGGPFVVVSTDDPHANPVSATLTCSIHVGWTNETHAGPVAVSASASGTHVVTLPPTVVSYRMPEDEFLVRVCTELAVTDAYGDTYRLYWDDVEKEFSSSPDVVCHSLTPEPLIDWELVDAIVCPVLALVFPPHGDIPSLWDCPPYDD